MRGLFYRCCQLHSLCIFYIVAFIRRRHMTQPINIRYRSRSLKLHLFHFTAARSRLIKVAHFRSMTIRIFSHQYFWGKKGWLLIDLVINTKIRHFVGEYLCRIPILTTLRRRRCACEPITWLKLLSLGYENPFILLVSLNLDEIQWTIGAKSNIRVKIHTGNI